MANFNTTCPLFNQDYLPIEIRNPILHQLDFKSLTIFQLVCSEANKVAKQDFLWQDYLDERGISVIPLCAKNLVISNIRKACTLFNYLGMILRDQNVFDAKKITDSRVPKSEAQYKFDRLFEGIGLMNQDSINEKERKIRLFLDFDISFDRILLCTDKLSDSILLPTVKRINKLSFNDVHLLVCSHPKSEVIFIALQKVDEFKEEDCNYTLKRALESKSDVKAISYLLNKVKCTTEHFEAALWSGYSERLIEQMFEKLNEQDFVNFNFLRVIPGLFYGKNPQGVKAGAEEYTYSEEFICKILERIKNKKLEEIKNIDSRLLVCALDRGFTESNLESFFQKCDNVSFLHFEAAMRGDISERIIFKIIEKMDPITNIQFLSALELMTSERLISALLEKTGNINEKVIEKVIELKPSNELSIKMISMIKGPIDGSIVMLAQEMELSEEIIKLMLKKCPNPPGRCPNLVAGCTIL